MKATGIVRRIDELGRIVIPKEICRMMRIRSRAPLEIFIHDDEIVLKKFSHIKALEDFTSNFIMSAFQVLERSIAITDEERVIDIRGDSAKHYIDRKIGPLIEKSLLSKTNVTATDSDQHVFDFFDNDDYHTHYITPIVLNGNAVGTIIILLKKNEELRAVDIMMAEFGAKFLADQLE